MILDYMLPESLILVCRTASVVGDMRSSTICTFWVPFFSAWTAFVRMCFSTQNTFWFFGAIWCFVLKTLALVTLLDRGCCPKFLDLENYACFLASPWNECFDLFYIANFNLIKGRSLSDLIFWISYVQSQHG